MKATEQTATHTPGIVWQADPLGGSRAWLRDGDKQYKTPRIDPSCGAGILKGWEFTLRHASRFPQLHDIYDDGRDLTVRG